MRNPSVNISISAVAIFGLLISILTTQFQTGEFSLSPPSESYCSWVYNSEGVDHQFPAWETITDFHSDPLPSPIQSYSWLGLQDKHNREFQTKFKVVANRFWGIHQRLDHHIAFRYRSDIDDHLIV